MSKTSTQSKRKYNNSAYTLVRAELDQQLVADWREALTEDGKTQAGFIRDAILNYLHERKGSETK